MAVAWPQSQMPSATYLINTVEVVIFPELKELQVELLSKYDIQATSRPTLETLPSELRRHLLLILELRELKNLVRASPIFHQQYMLDRRFVLLKSFERDVRSVGLDAAATHRSGALHFSTTRTKKSVALFLRPYRGRRRDISTYSLVKEGLTEADVVNMVYFHNTVVLPFMERYVDKLFDNFPKMDKSDDTHLEQEGLDATEEIRLLRAIYRFQLACNLFGSGRFLLDRPKTLEFEATQILKLFLCTYEPWEIEEIGCVCNFARETYHNRLVALWEDAEDSDLLMTDVDYEMEREVEYDHILKAAVSHGLEQLIDRIFDTDSEDEEYLGYSIMESHTEIMETQHLCGAFLQEAVLVDTQLKRRKTWPSRCDQREKAKEIMLFEGDQETAIGTNPPLAWLLLWGGTWSNSYGAFICDGLRRWGYVFWTSDRLTNAGLKRHVEKHLESHHGDPRGQISHMMTQL